MLTPVVYGNGTAGSPIGIATFPLQCQGFPTKLTCPILDLAEEFDVVLGYEWCTGNKAIISYKEKQVIFVHKN